ncbi:MAG: hypothetical protein JXQ87_07365 [Bacteroidia bacterium]
MKKNLPILLTIIVLAAAYRLFPNHIYNFTPVGAIALFSGAYLGKKAFSALIPLAIMLLSDVAIQLTGGRGFHMEMPFVYGAFLLTYLIGSKGLAGKVKMGRLFGASLASSAVFFVITNFGSWIFSPEYTKDIAGLITCYVAAIPFYNPGDYLSSFALNGFLGDMFFTMVLFGAYFLITRSNAIFSTTRKEAI